MQKTTLSLAVVALTASSCGLFDDGSYSIEFRATGDVLSGEVWAVRPNPYSAWEYAILDDHVRIPQDGRLPWGVTYKLDEGDEVWMEGRLFEGAKLTVELYEDGVFKARQTITCKPLSSTVRSEHDPAALIRGFVGGGYYPQSPRLDWPPNCIRNE